MKYSLIASIALLLVPAISWGQSPQPVAGMPAARSPENTKVLGYEFLKNAKFGIFVHYTAQCATLSPEKPKPAVWDWDAKVNAFDVKAFADAVEGMGAQYVTMTSFHAAMYLLAPSKVMVDAGLPTHQAKRDLLGELADELNKRGIALCLYVHPTDQHDLSKEERALFGWGPEVNGLPGPKLGQWPNPKWDAFVLGLFKEMSLRYGKRVSGWWIDQHSGKGFENAGRMAVALRAGNPDAVIWQNGGSYVQAGLSLEDAWKAGENGSPYSPVNYQDCLVATGDWQLRTGVAIPAPEVFRGVVRFAGCPGLKGGAHVALTPFADCYPSKVKELMDDFGKLWRERKVSLLNTTPSVIVEPERHVPWDIVATDSADGRTVYVHVLIPPVRTSVKLPAPKNGQKFTAATLLLGGKAVKMDQSVAGIHLTLPTDVTWDPYDTVIVLKVDGQLLR